MMFCIKKDGQPTKNDRYLAFVSFGKAFDGTFLGGYWIATEYCDGHWNCHKHSDGTLWTDAEMTDSITHWAYLPCMPEAEECLL